MKKLFLHIGFNKSGSTSLQRDLAFNSGKLLDQGILYPFRPAAAYMQGRQHVPLAAAVPGRRVHWVRPRKQKTLDRAYDALFAELQEHSFDTLVLSSESFGGVDMDAEKAAWIRDRFAGYEVHAVAYIRRQDGYFLSTYQQMIKGGGTKAFDFASYRGRTSLKFAARLDVWRQAFGPERVHVRPFEPRLWPGNELLYDFLDTIGARRDGIEASPPLNEGLDYRAVELLRLLNIEHQRSRSAAGGARLKSLELARNFEQFMPAGCSRQKMQLSTEQTQEMRAYFRADNEAALAGSGISNDDFFPAAPEGRKAVLPPGKLPRQLLIRLVAGLALTALPAAAKAAAAELHGAGKSAKGPTKGRGRGKTKGLTKSLGKGPGKGKFRNNAQNKRRGATRAATKT